MLMFETMTINCTFQKHAIVLYLPETPYVFWSTFSAIALEKDNTFDLNYF